jgi:hypothetical protein
MLSTATMGGGSFRYYQNSVTQGRCEYYLGVGEEPGRWHGRGIELLDLVAGGAVTEQQMEALFGRGLHPDTGEALGRAWRVDGVIGYDLCFSAPKSVSALWALGDNAVTQAIRAGHGAAVNAALDYLDAHASYSRVGRNGVTQVSTDGFAAAVFDHRTSRAGVHARLASRMARQSRRGGAELPKVLGPFGTSRLPRSRRPSRSASGRLSGGTALGCSPGVWSVAVVDVERAAPRRFASPRSGLGH